MKSKCERQKKFVNDSTMTKRENEKLRRVFKYVRKKAKSILVVPEVHSSFRSKAVGMLEKLVKPSVKMIKKSWEGIEQGND